jgi:hypothetical protein
MPCPGEPPQLPHGHREIAGAQLTVIREVLERAFVPNLHGSTMGAGIQPDPNTLWVIATGATWRGARGADHLRPALVPLVLFGEAVGKGAHQFLEPGQALDLGLLLAQEARGLLAQPFIRDLPPSTLARLETPPKKFLNGRSKGSWCCSSLTRQRRVRSQKSSIRAGSVGLNRFSGLIGGASTGFRLPRSAAAG